MQLCRLLLLLVIFIVSGCRGQGLLGIINRIFRRGPRPTISYPTSTIQTFNYEPPGAAQNVVTVYAPPDKIIEFVTETEIVTSILVQQELVTFPPWIRWMVNYFLLHNQLKIFNFNFSKY